MSCDQCIDPDGEPCFPQYGLAPHLHGTGPEFGVGTHFKPKCFWPENFQEDPDIPNHGVWWCSHCGDGKPTCTSQTLAQHEAEKQEPLVKRLRNAGRRGDGDADEAANEIERLNAELAGLKKQASPKPDMFWDAENPETYGDEIMDIASEFQPGEVIRLDCARRLPSITVLVTPDGNGVGYEIVAGITRAKT